MGKAEGGERWSDRKEVRMVTTVRREASETEEEHVGTWGDSGHLSLVPLVGDFLRCI